MRELDPERQYLLIVAISLDILGINRLPVGNLLPVVFLAPLLVTLFASS